MSKGFSDKRIVKLLIDNCVAKGLKHVVISPGSRNAPLIISFSACEEIECYSIVDERSAAFFALGMAQQLQQPIGLVCTSGTAVLNYAPALAEAYYQKIPLVVMTADRPVEWVNQADGQTINQNGIYSQYTKFSCNLPTEINTKDDEWFVNRSISEAFFNATNRGAGPVHINIPLREPLYGKTVYPKEKTKIIDYITCEKRISDTTVISLAERFSKHKSVMIVLVMMQPKAALNDRLAQLSKLPNVVVLTESTSNLSDENFISNIDRVVTSISESESAVLKPSLLITVDGPIISRLIKNFIKTNPPREHWHIDANSHHLDPFQVLTLSIESEPVDFFGQILPLISSTPTPYRDQWSRKNQKCKEIHNRYTATLPWCDFVAYDKIFKSIDLKYQLQLGNSTPVRYGQLFDLPNGLECYSNRGTSGIDGCISTAAGAAFASNKPTLLIVGDLSALYDSNGLWHNQLARGLKIVIINNGGGGIFRYISGPSSTDELEEYFEVSQQKDFSHLAALHNISYQKVLNFKELEEKLPMFLVSESCEILEIITPAKESARILKNYFETIKNQI